MREPARGFTLLGAPASVHAKRYPGQPLTGFIALTAAIVMSAILMGAAATLSEGTFFARFDGLNYEYRQAARTLADSCIEYALLQLRDDYGYRIQTDPAYDAEHAAVPVPMGTLYGKNVSCELLGPTTTPEEVDHGRQVRISARAAFAHAVVHLTGVATVMNPEYPTGSAAALVTLDAVHEAP